jgi:subtilisin family serine protease
VDERNYIVFEFDVPDVTDDDLKAWDGAELEVVPPTVRLHEEPMTPRQAADARRRPNRSVSEPMPIKLISPVSGSDAMPPEGPGETWGIRAVNAHLSPFTGAGITVAVLDTGLDVDHEAFKDIPEVPVRDFTGTGETDEQGHGTHCAGTIAGRDVNGYRFGVARGIAKLLGGKVLAPSSTTLHIADGIRWAVDEGANVISMSLGVDFPKFVRQRRDQGLADAAAISEGLTAYRDALGLFDTLAAYIAALAPWGRSCLLVAASGNESKRPKYRISASPPASAAGVVSVGALMEAAAGPEVTDFSNMGAVVAAPGYGVLSAKARGGYLVDSGTSMATPHVAGVAALWAQKLLETTGRIDVSILRNQLVGRSVLMGLSQDDVGAGLVQAPTAEPDGDAT